MPKGSGPLTSVAMVVGGDKEKHRLDQFKTIVEHCEAAQAIAEAQGDRFLSYMLAMTIQAAQASKCAKR